MDNLYICKRRSQHLHDTKMMKVTKRSRRAKSTRLAINHLKIETNDYMTISYPIVTNTIHKDIKQLGTMGPDTGHLVWNVIEKTITTPITNILHP